MGKLNSVVVLSTADYDAAVWTNKQHIASRLALTHEVVYINSLGLRAPRMNKTDVIRILKRLASKSSAKRATTPPGTKDEPKILAPRVIPWHGSALVRAVNRRILSRWWRKLPDEFDLWTFSPLTYGLEKRARKVIYQSVDLLHEFDNVPRRALLEGERALVRSANHVVASSAVIAEHLLSVGARSVDVWENVADTALFAREARRSHTLGERAGIIFAGNLSASKVDFELLHAVADSGQELYLAGPVAIDGSSARTHVDALTSRANVTYLGNLSQTELATRFARAKVGVIPYKVNEYTSGVFPMKVHEYRASGLRVVASRLPSLLNTRYEGMTVTDRDTFASAVESEYNNPPLELSDEALDRVSWESRLSQVRRVLDSSGDRRAS